jgi:hypothetical protein
MNARDFPMSCRAVFTGRYGIHRSPRAACVLSGRDSTNRRNVTKPARFHCREIKTTDGVCEIAECVAARVSIRFGVRRFTRTNSVEN